MATGSIKARLKDMIAKGHVGDGGMIDGSGLLTTEKKHGTILEVIWFREQDTDGKEKKPRQAFITLTE